MMTEDLPKLIVISGPTCSGKSTLAVALARLLGGEIMNSDSMQVYRGMDIGTSKLTVSERQGVPHHLIDIVDPDHEFNASLFTVYALPIIEGLHSKKIPIILAGGTGLYIKALTGGLFKCPPSDKALRRNLLNECEKEGSAFLHERLSRLDMEAAKDIHPMDKMRVIRALEVIHMTGNLFSELVKKHGFSDRKFSTLKFCINIDRELLYKKINERTVTMIDSGLIGEVEGLLGKGYDPELKPMQAIGYRHIVEYLKGRWSLNEAIGLIQRDTRRYAKRQLTWFKADPDTIWINPDDIQTIKNKIMSFVQ
jgi:tRNA dimethylallyltransferase